MENFMSVLTGYYNTVARLVLPVTAVLLLICCMRLLFRGIKKSSALAALIMDNGTRLPITSYECAVGRSRLCDISIAIPSISRRHAVITYDEYGLRISDAGSKGGVFVNDAPVNGSAYLEIGDTITLADVDFRLARATAEDDPPTKKLSKHSPKTSTALFFLSLFQILAAISLLLHYYDNLPLSIPICFSGLFLFEWIYFGIRRFKDIAIEIMAFFLSTLGMCVAASAVPSTLFKQFAAFLFGVGMFWLLCFIMKDIGRTMKMRYVIGFCAIGLLALNLILGVDKNGARNWINLGIATIQPSEFVKIAFIFAGCATLERLLTTRNLILFIGFSGVCIGALFLMRDFGTASIFFVTMLIIAYMRSGDLRAIALIVAAAILGAGMIITLKPYVASRFAAYRHVWEFAGSSGYQQTRTMIAIGSGGLFGVGGGNGNLDLVPASDTDLVFGFVSEEWGLIVALTAIACLIIFAIYAIRCTPYARSAYYAIAACAASGMFLFQAALNIFGSTDLLPLTGVTLPFISNGGSSMVASWAILAFIKCINSGERGERA